jgi:hypothetical protein
MGKDPAFLFYPGDYLKDTQCLSENAQVAYDRIMCAHMNNICISQVRLNFFIKKLNEEEREQLMETLKKVDNGYQIEWVVLSIENRKAYNESRRRNRKGKGKKKSNDINNTCKTYDEHMENENKIENVIVIEDEIEGKNSIIRNIEHRKCSKLLEKRILEFRQQKITDKTLDKWDRDVRLMIERDDRTVEEIVQLINECHDMPPNNGGFTWRNNILSMGKLRERWNEGKIYIGMNQSNQKVIGTVSRESVAKILNMKEPGT